MGLKINTTVPALNAQRQTGQAVRDLNKTLGTLATGQRINRAADDAAGLAIAERLRTQVRQDTQEINNLQTGVSVVQTADAALATQQEGIGRLQKLAVQAGNGTLNADQRAAINQEAQQIVEQIGQTAQNTEFNGTQLLNGTAGPIALGTEGGAQVNINESTPNALGLTGIDLGTQAGAQAAIGQLGNAANQISQNRGALGAQQNGLGGAIEARQTAATGATEAESRIRDLDVARGVVDRTRAQMSVRRSAFAVVQGDLIPQAAANLLGT